MFFLALFGLNYLLIGLAVAIWLVFFHYETTEVGPDNVAMFMLTSMFWPIMLVVLGIGFVCEKGTNVLQSLADFINAKRNS